MIEGLLKNKKMLRIFCDNAKEKSDELSVENWIRNIIIAFTDE